MTQKRPAQPKLISPRATFIWPKLTEPDYGTRDFPKPDGEYSVKLQFDTSDPAFEKFRAKVEKLHEKAVEAGEEAFGELKVAQRKKLGQVTVNPAFNEIYDEETEEPTGIVEMKVKMKASGEIKKGPRAGKTWSRKPDLFDAKGVKLPTKGLNIGGGTVGKVSFTVREYFVPANGACGLSFQLEGAQIIDLVSFGSKTASDHGFGEEEGGFSADDIETEDETRDEFDDEEKADGASDEDEPEGADDF